MPAYDRAQRFTYRHLLSKLAYSLWVYTGKLQELVFLHFAIQNHLCVDHHKQLSLNSMGKQLFATTPPDKTLREICLPLNWSHRLLKQRRRLRWSPNPSGFGETFTVLQTLFPISHMSVFLFALRKALWKESCEKWGKVRMIGITDFGRTTIRGFRRFVCTAYTCVLLRYGWGLSRYGLVVSSLLDCIVYSLFKLGATVLFWESNDDSAVAIGG